MLKTIRKEILREKGLEEEDNRGNQSNCKFSGKFRDTENAMDKFCIFSVLLLKRSK